MVSMETDGKKKDLLTFDDLNLRGLLKKKKEMQEKEGRFFPCKIYSDWR